MSGCSIVAPGCVGEVGDWDSAASAFVAAIVLSLTNASVAAGDRPLAAASALATPTYFSSEWSHVCREVDPCY